MKQNSWVHLLTYMTGLVNQELLLQNECLAAENRILRAQLPARLRLSDPKRATFAEVGKRLGRRCGSPLLRPLGGTGHFPITAMGSGRGGRLIRRWQRRSSISPKVSLANS
jgi:hypothetical protein